MPRIFDCFLFYDELDLLEIRLHELDPAVDIFVISEAHFDFKGRPKPLVFMENIERYSPFLHKIRYVECRRCPTQTPVTGEHWDNEGHQRNALMNALKDCERDDLILVSDCDEIPRAEILGSVPRDGRRYRLQLTQYHYNFNLIANSPGVYICDVGACSWGGIVDNGYVPCNIRTTESVQDIHNAGWHFTWLGGRRKIEQKIGWYSHPLKEPGNLQHVLASGDPLRYEPSIDALPDWVKRNQERYHKHFEIR